MGSINEELNYMKYLLGYQRGVVISEQKILLEQTKADYDQIASELTSAYGPTLKKYGLKDSIKFFGTDKNGTLIEDYTDKPTVIGISLSSVHNYDGSNYDTAYFSCLAPVKIINPITNKPVNTTGFLNNNFANFTPSNLDYRYSDLSGEKDDTKRQALRKNFNNTTRNIGKQICNLIESKSKGEDVTKQIEDIKKVESESQQKKTTAPTTQQTTTKPGTTATTKPGTIAAKTTTTQQTTTNPTTGGQNPIYDKPIITVTKQGNVWKVVTFGSFPANITKSNLAKDFIKEFVTKVFGDPVLQKTKGDVGITFARIRGGASNFNSGGAVLPDIKFDASKPTNYTTYTKIDKTKLDATKFTGDLTDNTELAKGRAANLFNEMKRLLPDLKNLAPDIFAEIQKNNPGTTPKVMVDIEPIVEGFNVETGGVADKDRDTKLYPVPGQHVYMDLTVQIEPNKVKSAECMKGLTIEVTHAPHNCDLGQYNLYINDQLIGMSDVSTKSLGTRSQPTLAKAVPGVTLNKYTNGLINNPGVRKDTFTIPAESVAKFLEKSTKGEVRISGQEWERGRHADQPFFTVKNASGTVLLKNFSPAALTPCTTSPCPKFDMVVFNPCSDDPATAILGNDYGKPKEEIKKT